MWNKRLNDPYGQDDNVRNWVLDVFLDKLFETNAKIKKVFDDFDIQRDIPIWEIKDCVEDLAFAKGRTYRQIELRGIFDKLFNLIQKYDAIFEKSMGTIRKILYDQKWEPMKNIKPEDYVLPVKRAKYVKARDELQKAKQAVKDKKWDEVLNHLRPAIDLAIKEKFGFKKIHPMKQFLLDAEKYNLPLPSYSMVYDYFDEGSQRIHGGKLHTPWECEEALNFVADFIDRLELIEMSQKDIEDFKKKSKAVG